MVFLWCSFLCMQEFVMAVDDVEKHKSRIRDNTPENGSVRMLVITEKQYEKNGNSYR